jgi:beta-galactosidase/beta-glucuronidase
MRSAILAILALCALPAVSYAERSRIELNGTWDFKLDPQDQGLASRWPEGAAAFDRTIVVPGAWQAQGIGEPRGTLRHDYAGPAWYRRTVAVPAAWRGKLVTLRIGGAHRETTLFVNGQRIGEHSGFSAPFTFDVTDAVRPGGDNVIALRIANPGAVPLEGPREQKPVRPTGMLNYIGNWGGIYGNVELLAAERTSIDGVYVRPDVQRRAATFVVAVQNRDTRDYAGEVRVTVSPGVEGRAPLTVPAGGRSDAEVVVSIPDARLWSPEQPHLYTAAITLRQG